MTILAWAASLTLAGCATVSPEKSGDDYAANKPPLSFEETTNAHFYAINSGTTAQEKDRLAILAMQGEYRVGFNFNETVVLKQGYQRHEPKITGAYETVVVVEQQPDLIMLQHLLVSKHGMVIKHWRQDWHYQATERFEFSDDQTWSMVSLPQDKVAGQWTQCVFEVSDAPRYCGTGKWKHKYGVSTWTSDRSWRPLPRREYTVREDYNALNVENRHTVTAHGWTHEQDNTKVVRKDGQSETLVREFGFNDYRRIDGFNFQPAYDYWSDTQVYWAHVRKAWNDRLKSDHVLVLNTEVDGMPIIEGTFEQADAFREGSEVVTNQIETLLGEHTRVTSSM